MVKILSAKSVVITIGARAEGDVKGVIKKVMLRGIVEPNFQMTNNNNPRENNNRAIGVTREDREVMERGAINVEAKHISERTAHS